MINETNDAFNLLLELSSRSSTSTNVQAGGDLSGDSVLNLIKSKSVFHWSKNKQQDNTDCYSSDSLKVNIGDLADAEELKKIAQIVRIEQEKNDFSSSIKQKSQNLIEDFHILNGFRLHSKEILTILSQKEILPYLFNYGEQNTGRKLLSIAAETGWYEGVLFLLNRGVNINETDHENRTALIDCLTSTDTTIMLALVKKSECNLNIQTLTGHTATHYAVMMNKISFFEILIKFGARLDLQNDKGENVLHQIIKYKRKQCWKIIKHFNKYQLYSTIYLKHLNHTETYEYKTCLILAFEQRPNIYFFKELLPYTDIKLINIELFQSWSKAYKLIRNLFF
ncbi:unnamed protein product [Rotaria sordida]|uniref:Ankyrin repeat protein n=1 Tax=Rotaria sordida TaxID=392033 RepID=A0A814DFP3_9BILA|nr:unnamed protein product [Rotaria sordida]CAF1084382.1 unnamed protein product [Rotaria sordida]CAF3509135.1 unnamed protein product [Rotaria sordida]CAF3565987.1 unnamed protein product [Rotaria sordida]